MSLKIERLKDEVQQKVLESRVSGKTYKQIAEELNESGESEDNINVEDVVQFFNKNISKVVKVLKDNPKLQEKVSTQYFNTLEQLNRLNEEMWDLYYNVKQDPELQDKKVTCPHCARAFNIQIKQYSELIKISQHLLNQIGHADKVLGKLQTKSLNITYNFSEMNSKILQILPTILKRLERQDIIKINKRKAKKLLEFQ